MAEILPLSPIDKIILNTTLSSIETIDNQIEVVSKEIAKYAWQDSQDIKILLSITGIDIFSAIVLSHHMCYTSFIYLCWCHVVQ